MYCVQRALGVPQASCGSGLLSIVPYPYPLCTAGRSRCWAGISFCTGLELSDCSIMRAPHPLSLINTGAWLGGGESATSHGGWVGSGPCYFLPRVKCCSSVSPCPRLERSERVPCTGLPAGPPSQPSCQGWLVLRLPHVIHISPDQD